MAELLLTTHPGLEAFALAEVRELARASGHEVEGVLQPEAHMGRVLISSELSEPALEAIVREARSLHHVIRLVAHLEVPKGRVLETLCEAAKSWSLPELATESWCVRCLRVGEHEVGSEAIEREVGAVLFRRVSAPVRLKTWDACIRIELRGERAQIGLQRTRPALSHRWYPRPYQQRTALKANVAYAALTHLPAAPQTLLDPFCGSGTLLLEAAAMHPNTQIYGSDRRTIAANGCAKNLDAFGFETRSTVRQGDAMSLADVWPALQVDAIITNPPYGVRMGAALDFRRFYRELLSSFQRVLHPKGTAILFAVQERALEEAAAALGWSMDICFRADTRSVRPAIARLNFF